MEKENISEEQFESGKETKSGLHTVTPLSKYLAMALFIILPFLGGWIGYTYAPEKIVGVEKVVEIKSAKVDSSTTKDNEIKPPTTQPVSVQKAISVIRENKPGWPSIETKYDYSGTTSIPWYDDKIIKPDVNSLNKTNPQNAFETCGVSQDGNFNEAYIQKIIDKLSWSVGTNYNGMTYEGFECIGDESEPWDQVIRFIFRGDFSATGLLTDGMSDSSTFILDKESSKKYSFLQNLQNSSQHIRLVDRNRILGMYRFPTALKITTASDFFYYRIYPYEVYSNAEMLLHSTELGHDVPFELSSIDIHSYNLHEVITEPIDWENYY